MRLNETLYRPINWIVVPAALLAVFLLAGCDRQEQAPPPRPAPEVSTVTVRIQKVVLATELPGRTSAFRVADIRPQVSGLILKRLFTEGSDVKAGQALYQIDPAPFQAALDTAQAALDRSEAQLPAIRAMAGRYKALLGDKLLSQQDYDDSADALAQAEADIQYWKASLEAARINLGYTMVTAPIPGRIGKSNVTDGAIVTAYQPVALATIQQLDPIYVDVPQSTTDLLRLRSRLKDGRLSHDGTNQNRVKLILEDGTAYPLEGTLRFRDVTVDPTTGSVIMRAVFPNPEGVLLPGMFVQTVIKEGVNEQAVLISQQAVSRNPKGEPFALIVDAENKVGLRMLTLERALGDKWLVSEGLAPGDTVIVEGLQLLRPGASVKAVPFKESGITPVNAARPTAESN